MDAKDNKNKITESVAPDNEVQKQPKKAVPEGWKIKKIIASMLGIVLVGIIFIGYSCFSLLSENNIENQEWITNTSVSDEMAKKIDAISTDATQVTVGVYTENLKEISLKTNSYRGVFKIWFKWDGDRDLDMINHFTIYKGYINSSSVIKDYHEGNTNYQLIKVDATISKTFRTDSFPLDSHQLRIYVESNYTVNDVVFVGDYDNCSVNGSLSISGYNLTESKYGILAHEYNTNNGDPELQSGAIVSEFMSAVKIERNSFGLYSKCFVALFGTSIWVLITLFLCTYHTVDPLSMIPGALFGTVSNIMIGANLLPDALGFGLLEFVNIFGVYTILAVALAIININRVRNKYHDSVFAGFYGKLMFYSLMVIVIAGHILIPLSAIM